MCGIVGILGNKPVAGDLVDALRRLEYRGYDSAGIATVENGSLDRRRAEGKLRNLELRLVQGAAARPRRHRPHALGDARPPDREQRASAHERARLGRAQRHHREFRRAARRSSPPRATSSRPTPTPRSCVHLITDEMLEGHARRWRRPSAALRHLQGAFALAIIFAGEDNLMIGARQGSPLAIGHGQGEMYLGSDAIALAPFTSRSPISRKATGRC